jgi:putative endonuclease
MWRTRQRTADTNARAGGDMTSIVRAVLNRLLGERGERAAARHLKRQGMRILLRGYRTERGEIDLIARDGDTLVFVEVKARRQGVPAEAVTPEKQRRLTNVAFQFMRKYHVLEVPSRFDVVAIVWPDDQTRPQIDHFRNAFEPVGRWQMFR